MRSMCDADAACLAMNFQSLSSDLRVDACLDLPGASVGIHLPGFRSACVQGLVVVVSGLAVSFVVQVLGEVDFQVDAFQDMPPSLLLFHSQA